MTFPSDSINYRCGTPYPRLAAECGASSVILAPGSGSLWVEGQLCLRSRYLEDRMRVFLKTSKQKCVGGATERAQLLLERTRVHFLAPSSRSSQPPVIQAPEGLMSLVSMGVWMPHTHNTPTHRINKINLKEKGLTQNCSSSWKCLYERWKMPVIWRKTRGWVCPFAYRHPEVQCLSCM